MTNRFKQRTRFEVACHAIEITLAASCPYSLELAYGALC